MLKIHCILYILYQGEDIVKYLVLYSLKIIHKIFKHYIVQFIVGLRKIFGVFIFFNVKNQIKYFKK